ncbi:MAG: lactate utilization protein [Planctomycetes bacterium]|nr:lactate utilization protein [Planctomycetota bacterium]
MSKIIDQFSKAAVATGAQVHGPYDYSALPDHIINLINSKNARKIAGHWFSDALNKKLTPALQKQSFDFISNPESPETDFGIGITEVDFGIAETGTIGIESSDPWARKVSALPLIHLAILDQSKIFTAWPEALEAVNKNPSDYYALITGPSRTADIERVLTLGVHGPEELYILLVK